MLILHSTHVSKTPGGRREVRAKASAAAYTLLHDLTDALHLPTAPLAVTDRGRPYFEGLTAVDFSIAHTNTLAVCALAYRQEDFAPRVGVDVETRTAYGDEKITAFAKRFFAAHEQAYVLGATDRAAAFTEVFTKKEAFAKWTGVGLGKHLSATDTLCPRFEEVTGVRFYQYREGDVFICLCVSGDCDEVPVWFSKKHS